jgi:hypothetical protein
MHWTATNWISRARMTMARRPWIHWLIVGTLAVTVATSIAVSLAGVRHERESWGRTTTVFVATRALAPGEPIADAVERRQMPLAVVPESAMVSIDAGAAAIQRISAGEMIVQIDVAATSGPLALLPAGWLAIDITDVANAGLFSVGDAASVLADGVTIAPTATVVAVTPTDVVVGVPAADAPVVAKAANERAAVVALRAA